MLAPSGSGTAAEPAHLPECQEIEERSQKGDEHHGDADGIDVETLGESPGGGSQHDSPDSDQKADAVKGNEGGANTLEEGQEEAGPIEPLEAGGWLTDGGFIGKRLRLERLGHGRFPCVGAWE